MSIASSMMSMTSVSCFGDEMNLEVAIDRIFKELQDHLNHLHCGTRSICMMIDQDSDYEEGLKASYAINDNVDEMGVLFKELKGVIKQVSIKPQDQEEKDILKAFIDQRKLEKAMAKTQIKAGGKPPSQLTSSNLGHHNA